MKNWITEKKRKFFFWISNSHLVLLWEKNEKDLGESGKPKAI